MMYVILLIYYAKNSHRIIIIEILFIDSTITKFMTFTGNTFFRIQYLL